MVIRKCIVNLFNFDYSFNFYVIARYDVRCCEWYVWFRFLSIFVNLALYQDLYLDLNSWYMYTLFSLGQNVSEQKFGIRDSENGTKLGVHMGVL